VVNHHRIWSEQRLVKAISPRGALASGERWLCSPEDEVARGKSPCPPSEGGQVRGDESLKLRADASQSALMRTSPPPGSYVAVLPPPFRAVGEMNEVECGKSPCPPCVAFLPLAGGKSAKLFPQRRSRMGERYLPALRGRAGKGAREHQVEGGRVSISVDGNTPPSPATTTSPVLPPQAEGETRVAVQLEIRSQVAKKGHRSRKKAESLRGRFYGP